MDNCLDSLCRLSTLVGKESGFVSTENCEKRTQFGTNINLEPLSLSISVFYIIALFLRSTKKFQGDVTTGTVMIVGPFFFCLLLGREGRDPEKRTSTCILFWPRAWKALDRLCSYSSSFALIYVRDHSTPNAQV